MSKNIDRVPDAAVELPTSSADAWSRLRTLTSARIGLSRSGASLTTQPLLEFRLAHARARDAVHDKLDDVRFSDEAGALHQPILAVNSAVKDRQAYVLRPDLGRCLSPEAEKALVRFAGTYDLALVVVDGLSARAVQSHAVPVLAAALAVLRAEGWRLAPLVIVHRGRVAIGDAVSAQLGAGAVAVLIGERPGLSSPDSMSAYLTWRPSPLTTDAERNCISNIRPQGIGYAEAAFKLLFLLSEMRKRQLSGIRLKDESDHPVPPVRHHPPGQRIG